MGRCAKNAKRCAIGFLSVLLILFLVWIFPNHKYNGIDISHYNKGLDWSSVKTDENIKFCIVKATEGESWVDGRCIDNVKNSNKIGLKTGLYHYFRTGVSGKRQFENFDKVLKQCKYDIIPVVDVEEKHNDLSLGGCANENLDDLLECFKEEYGYYPMVYFGSWDALNTLPVVTKCKWWLRCIGFRNLAPSTIQQVGIRKMHNSSLDLNYCSDISSIMVPEK
ncbi:glycoside hydrolase family 25 protein [Sodaliphilus sp.]|uniref:glycoside hydrolase family 25 protein n=1 Tax=Sodaliphilus sp. TaxID=2815818 RepID=UPI00388F66E8